MVRHDNEALLDRYVQSGYQAVDGWVSADDLRLFVFLDQFQKTQGIRGNICEIGVYAGKRFILLYLARRSDETAVAIDPFGDEAGSPEGVDPEERFRANLRTHGGGTDDLAVIRRDSATVSAPELIHAGGGAFRLFSVDGAHTAEIVHHDLDIACRTVARGGVIIIDDYFNETWPGVSEGSLKYLMSRPEDLRDVVPFAIFSTKVFLTHREFAGQYIDHLKNVCRVSFRAFERQLLGEPVLVFRSQGTLTLANRLAATPAWKFVRSTPLGPVIRWGLHKVRS